MRRLSLCMCRSRLVKRRSTGRVYDVCINKEVHVVVISSQHYLICSSHIFKTRHSSRGDHPPRLIQSITPRYHQKYPAKGQKHARCGSIHHRSPILHVPSHHTHKAQGTAYHYRRLPARCVIRLPWPSHLQVIISCMPYTLVTRLTCATRRTFVSVIHEA